MVNEMHTRRRTETLADDERGVHYLLIIHPYDDINWKPLRKG